MGTRLFCTAVALLDMLVPSVPTTFRAAGWRGGSRLAFGPMRRRSFYVLAAVGFALVIYVALGIARTRGSDVAVLIIVVAGSFGAGTVAWRFANTTQAAVRDAERGREELALIGTLSVGLSGPLSPTEVATAFLDGIKGQVSPSAVTTLLQYQEAIEAVRGLPRQGGGTGPPGGVTNPVGAPP